MAILKLLNHPNVIKLQEFIDTQSHMFLVLELCNEGELHELIKSKVQVPEIPTAFIIKKIIETLQYIHRIGIVHCDLKPENVLIVN